MATFRLTWRSRAKKDGTMPLRIRINHNYTSAETATPWSITEKDIDRKGNIKNNDIVYQVNAKFKEWSERIEKELSVKVKDMTAKDILDWLTEEKKEETFALDIIKYAREDGDKLIATGHAGTGGLRITMANNLCKFLGKESLPVEQVTARLLNEWVQWNNEQPSIGDRKKGGRAAALYIAQLKAVYNKAKMEFNDEEAGIVHIPFNPFAKVKVDEPIPEKRSITIEQLRAVMSLPYRAETQPNHANRFNLAKDVFLLSFYLMGMNAADLYNCPQQEGERITYQRTKTKTRRKDKAEISILIPTEASELVAKYRGTRSYFVFSSMYSSVNTFNAALSKGLDEVGKAIGVPDLQFYAARHTWATIAYNDAAIDKGVVSDALNHVDTKMSVTDRYIRKDWSRIDEANKKVIALVTASPKLATR